MKKTFEEIFELGDGVDGAPVTVRFECFFFGRRFHKGDVIQGPKIANNEISYLRSRTYSVHGLDSGIYTVSFNMD